ncbi:MAG: hypothetical protein A3C43_07460 [Candidatus Schekmanbacteria bacterium RIFCSPHIGHO2_02_FULL_38_11]|nr:MAG: hypothetical protein A3C43_07460 [Candidatus Schekmanbacteria bacterium RIFCSPHIGHO2_02_FULL_38_11]
MKRFYKEERGFALALVLLITTLVVITVLEFNYEMRVDASIASNYRDDLKALYIAKGGVNAAIALLRQDFRTDKERHAGQQVDSLDEDWAKPEMTLQIGKGVATGMIIDESGKINLNEYLKESEDEEDKSGDGKNKGGGEKSIETKEEQKENIVRRIFDNLSVSNNNTDEIIESLLDWLGESSEDNPSIEAYYHSSPSPYDSKISLLDDITELILVKGMSKNVFYQEKEKNLYEEITGQEKDETEISKPFPSIFTVYSKLKGEININTAPKEVLLALHEDMDEETVSEIIDKRTEEPFESKDEVKKLSQTIQDIFEDKPEGLKGIRDLIDVKSNFFRIIAHGTINNVTKTIEAVVFRDAKNDGRITIKSWAEF